MRNTNPAGRPCCKLNKNTVKKLWPLLLIIAGCAAPKVINSWKAENLATAGFKKIIVIALLPPVQNHARVNLENELVKHLNGLGYNACAANVNGPALPGTDEQAAIAKLRDSGFDAALTIVLTDKKSERKYVPDNLYYPPYGDYYSRFEIYRNDLFNQAYKPGYYVIDTDFLWRTSLFDLKANKLIYYIKIYSVTGLNSKKLAAAYATMVINNLQQPFK